MNPQEIAAYLRVWAKMNAQEVYGSPREYVSIHELNNQLDKIADSEKESNW